MSGRFKRMSYLAGLAELFEAVNKELSKGDLADALCLYF